MMTLQKTFAWGHLRKMDKGQTMKDTLVWKRSASVKTAKSTEWRHQLRVWFDRVVRFILKRPTCRKRKMLSLCQSCMQQRQVWPQITSLLRIWAMSKQEWGLILLCLIISPDILKLLTFIQHREFWTRVPLTEANSGPKRITLSFTISAQHSIPRSKSYSCRLSIPVHQTIWRKVRALWSPWYQAANILWVINKVSTNQSWTLHRYLINQLNLYSTSRPSRCSNICRATSSITSIQQWVYFFQILCKVWLSPS